MSLSSIQCSACSTSLPASSFSKSQVNKLEHNKIQSIRCISCTEIAVVAKDGPTKVRKEKADKVEKVETVVKVESKHSIPKTTYDPSLAYIKSPDKTPIIADAITFAKSYDLEYNVKLGPINKWRTVVKLAVRGVIRQNKQGEEYVSTTMGLFKPGSHTVVSCTESTAHHVIINKALVRIEQARRRARVEGYIEGSGYDASNDSKNCYLKYVCLTLARQTNKVQLSLVWNTEPTGSINGEAKLAKFVSELFSEGVAQDQTKDKLPESSDLFHSVWVNYNPSSRYNNAITGRGEDAWRLLFGERYAREVVATNMANPPQLMFPPFVFRQANICAFTNIICNIRHWIKDMVDKKYPPDDGILSKKRKAALLSHEASVRGVKCVELYAGVGTIGLNCLDWLTELNCSDENPHNLACFEAARASMEPESVRRRASYRSEPAGAVAASGGLRGFELILVDPPRKGLDEEVLQAMLHYDPPTTSNNNNNKKNAKDKTSDSADLPAVINAERLIYVSCGFPAFMRDAARLTGRTSAKVGEENVRHWKLSYMEGHVLFPGSDHIETLAIFDRL